MEQSKEWILIATLLAVIILAFVSIIKLEKYIKPNFFLIIICLCFLLFTCIKDSISVQLWGTFLGLRGDVDKVETKNEEIEKQNDKLKKVTSYLTKMIYVASDEAGIGYFSSGIPKEHQEKIDEYKNEVSDLLPTGFEDELSKDLNEIHFKKQKRIEERKKR